MLAALWHREHCCKEISLNSNELLKSFFSICTVAIGKPERRVRKASHCGSKQQ